MIPRIVKSLVLILFFVSAAEAQAQQSPDEFLESFGQEAITELTDGSLPQAQREARFKEMLDRGFDLEAVSRFIIARYWRSAEEADRQAFIETFKDYLSQRFLPLFAEYEGDFSTGGTRVDSDNPQLSWVRVTFRAPNGQPVSTDWRLRQLNGGYKIVDIRAEGASLALTLREEYASVMRREGGLAGLVEQLRAQVARGAFVPD